jgi:hypothetical protein
VPRRRAPPGTRGASAGRTGSCWSRASETGRTRAASASRAPLDALGADNACARPVLITL